jgi:RNA polymerase sigma-70 factor (ECF subfamily)
MEIHTFRHIIKSFQQKLFRFALRIVGNRAEAEDVVQEVFIKLWDKRATWDEYENLEALCIRMTKNLAIDKTRSKHYRLNELPEELGKSSGSKNPHKIAEQQDAVASVRQMMLELPEQQRLIMKLRDIDGMSYKEIGETLNVSMNQVKVYLSRARKQVRTQLIKKEAYGL